MSGIFKKKEIPGHLIFLSTDKQFKRAQKSLRKHLGNSVIISVPSISNDKVQTVSEDKLRDGEISAITYSMGNYAIRIAQVIYKDSNGTYYSDRVPADKNQIDVYKKYLDEERGSLLMGFEDSVAVNGTRLVQEVYVACKNTPNPKWRYVCLTTSAKSFMWTESISFIGMIKKNF